MAPEPIYNVEAIVDKRNHEGRLEYLVKWQDWPSDQNTWEPEDHLETCLDLIEVFERRQCEEKLLVNKMSSGKRGRPRKTSKAPDLKSKNLSDVALNDSEESTNGTSGGGRKSDEQESQRKLKPKEIIGIWKDEDDGHCFLLKLEDREDADLIPAKLARKECPQLVIQFYEKRISWKSKT